MAKEKFLIIARPAMDDCFGRFSESHNREAISNGTMDSSDPYAWIEKTFEIVLVRDKEATHICSFTPSAYYIFLQNYFVGVPNEAWDYDGDPEGLEQESGGERHGYGPYRDSYDPRFICNSFVIDTVKDLGIRKPKFKHSPQAETYHSEIWRLAEDVAREFMCDGFDAPIFDVYTYRQWERDCLEKIRREACEESKWRADAAV